MPQSLYKTKTTTKTLDSRVREDDRSFFSAHPFVWVRLEQNPGFLYLTGSPIKNVGDKRRE